MNNEKKSYNLLSFVGDNCRLGNKAYMYYNIHVSKFFIPLVTNVKVFTIIFTVYTYFDMPLYCTVLELVFWFVVSGNLTRRLSVEGASGSQSSGTNNTRQSQPADKLPKIGEHTLNEHRYNPTYSNPTAEVRKSANSAKGSELKKSNSAKQMYIATMADSPENSSGFVKSEERPFRLPPIRDGGSQIPGNSGILCSGQLVGNDLDDGDGSLAWEVDVSDMLPHGRSGRKPGLFYFFACLLFFVSFF